MDLLFVVIAGSIGLFALVKGKIKVSKTKEIIGQSARFLGLIYIASSAFMVWLEFIDINQATFAANLLGMVIALLVVSILFIVFASKKIEFSATEPSNENIG